MEPNQQPERLTQWTASFHERQTALFIAGVCIVIIAAAIIAPRWFASKSVSPPSEPTAQPEQTQAMQPESSAQPTYRISSPAPVAGVSTETPLEHAKPEMAAAPTAASRPEPVASQIEPAPKPVAEPVTPAAKPAVAPTKPKAAAAPKPHPSIVSKAPAGYFVQVGAFKERKLADDLLKKLTDHGFNSRLVERNNGMIGVWIGPENNHKAAETLQQELQKRLKLKGFITHSG